MEPTDKLTELQVHAVLFQAGYLTIKGLDPAGRFLLGYPNREVKASMAQLCASLLTRNENFDACDVLEAMKTGKVDEVIAFFNKVVNAFDYHHFLIKDVETCRSCFQMLMYALSLRPEIEVHSAQGRSDLEVNAGRHRWVFEYKYARKGEDPQALLDIAARQIIGRRYGCTPHQQKILFRSRSKNRLLASGRLIRQSPQLDMPRFRSVSVGFNHTNGKPPGSGRLGRLWKKEKAWCPQSQA